MASKSPFYPESPRPAKRPARGHQLTPQSLEAEQSTLGAMIIERGALDAARAILQTVDFYRELHRKIFAVICELADTHRGDIDFVMLTEELRRRGQLGDVGGTEYVAALIEACPSTANVGAYARTVAELAFARRASELAEMLAARLRFVPEQGVGGAAVGEFTSFSSLVETSISHLKDEADRFQSSTNQAARYSFDSALDSLVADVSWLWRGWIPRGSLTMIAGLPDVGKSTVALDLCKRLIMHASDGRGEWPDGQPIDESDRDSVYDGKMRFLWIDTESALALLRQRIINWGIPRDHFAFPEGREMQPLRVDNDADWAWIRVAVRDLKPPLVIVDSLSYSYDKGSENDNDWMKFVMRRLADLASEFNTAVVVIHHLTKIPSGFAEWPLSLNMIRGASAITQFPRSILGLGRPHKDDPTNCGMMSVKLNLDAKPEPLGYTPSGIEPAWGEAPEPSLVGGSVSAKEKAGAFLLEFLAGGPKWSRVVYEECEKRGICSKRTLDDVKGAFVECYKNMDQWVWQLKNTALENADASQELRA